MFHCMCAAFSVYPALHVDFFCSGSREFAIRSQEYYSSKPMVDLCGFQQGVLTPVLKFTTPLFSVHFHFTLTLLSSKHPTQNKVPTQVRIRVSCIQRFLIKTTTYFYEGCIHISQWMGKIMLNTFTCSMTVDTTRELAQVGLTMPLGPKVVLIKSPMAMAPTNDDCSVQVPRERKAYFVNLDFFLYK